MTWRPTPTVAAFGRVVSGGTSTTVSLVAGVRQASRQPSASSALVYALMSRLDGAGGSSAILIRHFLQVPCPPQVESIAMPFQLAASNRVTPYGTRTGRSLKIRFIRTGPCATSSVTVTCQPAVLAPLLVPGPALPLAGPPAGRGARRSRTRPTRRGSAPGRRP